MIFRKIFSYEGGNIMQFCPMCGASSADDARHCGTCGATLSGGASAAAGYRSPSADPFGSAYQQPAQNSSPYQYQNSDPFQSQNMGYGYNQSPINKLRTNRSLAKMFFLSLVTFGIYGLVVMCHISSEINLIAFKHDGKKTMHYALVYFIFSWLTFGILPLVWTSNLCARIGRELRTRNINYNFGAGTFWLWKILGLWIVCGPFIYTHKLMKAMNLLAADYNVRG